MKHGKCPTRAQKIFLKEKHLNPDNWFVCRDNSFEMEIEHRHTGKRRIIEKERG